MYYFARVRKFTVAPLTYTCIHCERRMSDDTDVVWADLNGVPFRDYYCWTCKASLEKTEESRTLDRVCVTCGADMDINVPAPFIRASRRHGPGDLCSEQCALPGCVDLRDRV